MKTGICHIALILLLLFCGGRVFAIEPEDSIAKAQNVSDTLKVDTATLKLADALLRDSLKYKPSKFQNWKPDPIRSMWIGLVIPGGGQIYNRKYWKLPIFYGGFLGCIYALTWNGQMLRDYSQAYQDLTDDDPTTKSYEEMLPIGYKTAGRESYLANIFSRKKKTYRRYRDLSIFAIVAVYALSIIDAYVDAELSTFDVSRNLSLRWSPAYLQTGARVGSGPGLTVQLTY